VVWLPLALDRLTFGAGMRGLMPWAAP